MKSIGLVFSVLPFLCVLCASVVRSPRRRRAERAWITCEDLSRTRLLRRRLRRHAEPRQARDPGVRYTHAFAPIGVCARSRSSSACGPRRSARSTCVSGHAAGRRQVFPALPPQRRLCCTNNAKTDYNFAHPKATWDESSKDAHWRKRPPASRSSACSTSRPATRARSAIRPEPKRSAELTPQRHDPGQGTIPPYHPDTPEVRRDWAGLYDLITFMDKEVGGYLKQLDDDGLADDPIVFFFSDHGAGMPRSKRGCTTPAPASRSSSVSPRSGSLGALGPARRPTGW